MTPSGIEPAAFRFVAQHLNHCATAVPRYNKTCRNKQLTANYIAIKVNGKNRQCSNTIRAATRFRLKPRNQIILKASRMRLFVAKLLAHYPEYHRQQTTSTNRNGILIMTTSKKKKSKIVASCWSSFTITGYMIL